MFLPTRIRTALEAPKLNAAVIGVGVLGVMTSSFLTDPSAKVLVTTVSTALIGTPGTLYHLDRAQLHLTSLHRLIENFKSLPPTDKASFDLPQLLGIKNYLKILIDSDNSTKLMIGLRTFAAVSYLALSKHLGSSPELSHLAPTSFFFAASEATVLMSSVVNVVYKKVEEQYQTDFRIFSNPTRLGNKLADKISSGNSTEFEDACSALECMADEILNPPSISPNQDSRIKVTKAALVRLNFKIDSIQDEQQRARVEVLIAKLKRATLKN